MLDYIVLDIECTKKPKFKPWIPGAYLCSICIEQPDGTSKVWFFNPLKGNEEQHLKEIQDLISASKMIVGHNIKFDMLWLLACKLDLDSASVWDTMVGHYLLKAQQPEGGLNLDDVSAEYGGGQKVDEMKEWWNNGYETDQIPLELHERYVKQDVNLTHQIFKQQKEMMEKFQLSKCAELTFAMTKILAEVEFTGAPFIEERAHEFCDKARTQVEELNKQLIELAGIDFNPASSAQLSAILFGGQWEVDGREEYEVTLKSGIIKKKSRKCKVPVKYPGLGFKFSSKNVSKKTGKPSTDSQAISSLHASNKRQRAFLETLSQQRKVLKTISTIEGAKGDKGWLACLTGDGRLHGQFNQTITKTGRLSSSEPNMQNLPRSKGDDFPLKRIFCPTDGNIMVNCDLGQIEWKVAADLCRDECMVNEIVHGLDVHTANAEHIFGVKKADTDPKKWKELRTTAKTVSFRSLYGGGAYGFYYDSRMPSYSLEKWEDIMDAFHGKYPGLATWQNDNKKLALYQGWMRTPSGRVLKLNPDEPAAVCNYPVQSFSADLYNLATVVAMKRVKDARLRAKLVLLVHDSLVFECHPEDAEALTNIVIGAMLEIPELSKQYFGHEMAVATTADAEVGIDYGSTSEVNLNEVNTRLIELGVLKGDTTHVV